MRKPRFEELKCQYEKCGKKFTAKIKGYQRSRKYCSAKCAHLALRGQHGSLKAAWEARKLEAKKRGISADKLLEMKLNEYWERVKDPNYYGVSRRIPHTQSCLGGL